METNNEQKYIDTLIDTFNKYDYYTNDQNTIESLKNLITANTNKDLFFCLKELHKKNLVYSFLHQKSYINSETNNTFLDLNENFAKLLIYLDKNPEQEIPKKINPTIKPSVSSLSYLMLIDKKLDINSINKSISLTENAIKNISVDSLFYPLMFNENKKMFDVPDYYGRFSNKEFMIEIPQIDTTFKSSTLTHESFHALDTYIFNNLQKEFPNLKTDAKEFTGFVYATQIYEEIPEVFEINLQDIKSNNNYKSFFEFCNKFDKIPQSKKLSKEDAIEYIKKYLNINIKECTSPIEFTQQVLEIYSNEKYKLSENALKIIIDNTDKIKLLSKEIFDYYNTDYNDKSMYSLMSDMISKLASEKNDYRCSLNEKCARVFEMNSYSNNNADVYSLLSESISEKNIYPIGNEREFYVSYLNKELKNMSNLLNQQIFIAEPLPIPRKTYNEDNIPEGFNLSNSKYNQFDLSNISKVNALMNIQKIRKLQNNFSNHNKLRI